MTLNRTIIFLGMSIAIGFSLHSSQAAVDDSVVNIGPCSRFDDVYEQFTFSSTRPEEWPEIYHTTVAQVVAEYVDIDSRNAADCTAESADRLLPAGDQLRDLADKLPLWQTEEALIALRRSDLGAVLLEHLRLYECTLNEENQLLLAQVFARDATTPAGSSSPILDTATYLEISGREQSLIDRELRTARPALNETLKLLSLRNLTSAADAELECLQRSSLDIRNAFSLSAEAMQCLPRTFDVRDPLHPVSDGS